MKKVLILFLLINNFLLSQSWIRVNQLGYKPNSIKVAVLLSKENLDVKSFDIYESLTDKLIFTGKSIKNFGKYTVFNSSFRLDFSKLKRAGNYYIKVGQIKSPTFEISENVYNGTADFILKYMRQQRCGYNPFLKDSCHTYDGFIIYHPDEKVDSTYIDVRGGWHDATDYLQYVTTSANAIFQMLLAYEENPNAFGDFYDANGNEGSNGIPDILDEVKWGLDWLVRMNPKDGWFFNQIADDRDHRGFRLPNKDTVKYSPTKGLQRPVYFCNGQPQGAFKYKNRANGVASTAGKFSSAFSLGAKILKKYYPDFAKLIEEKAKSAYEYGVKNPGVAQTAPCVSPYFYEEDNYTDDMQLAAAQLYLSTKDEKYLKDAVEFGEKEIVTPWMGADTARHYQWYPFLNLGHYYLAKVKNKKIANQFTNYLKLGLEKIYNRGKNNPFLNGIPFIWCSNNLTVAAITQANLYYKITKDKKFLEMEAALLDWLFGCNPWGTSMIVGLPEYGDYPEFTHSSIQLITKRRIDGGLVDGPVYGSIFKSLLGLTLTKPDEYAEFQSDLVVYHDDYGDYSTNEPTMDGTASLSYYLSSLESKNDDDIIKGAQLNQGGIVRFDKNQKNIYLAFTGHEFADGGDVILNTLKRHNIKASFFFTGDFYRNKNYENLIKKLKSAGHYLGAHSDKHLLYSPWENRDSLLITKEEFLIDLKNNYAEMERFGIKKTDALFYMPPYEYYNQIISNWAKEIGLTIVNFTPGTLSNADYTIPEYGNKYYSSDSIFNRIVYYEKNESSGLNGHILLTHIGTHPSRTDKFYNRLDELITYLKSKGYQFKRL